MRATIPSIVRIFIKDETAGAKLILLAALLSLAIVNSPLRSVYSEFWHLPLSIGLGDFTLSLDLRHWLNEALMAFFFLVVGLEIKRELVKGELHNLKVAALPIGAAVGGMILPALIYIAFNQNTETFRGWGIPIATDIAFAVAVLTLLGHRVPLPLKLFLLTLAIADDIGAIIVIALFYAEIINHAFLLISVTILTGLVLFRNVLTNSMLLLLSVSLILWITTHLSGIHASIVGAAVGLLVPVTNGSEIRTMAPRLERLFLPFSTFVVLPLFAFANAGVVLTGTALITNQSVMIGIILGLVLGKAIGIAGASWLLVRLGIAQLPQGTNWRHIIGVGFIAGIGFTVSIFITELAFVDTPHLITAAKVSIFIASALSALLGILTLLAASVTKETRSKLL
ncbi:Na+/H+ antiporter NhaA [Candidatus Saccharibacteria bacterium]|nr:MAG: Na+/H+ antiporter NhaA [Candidatus Saccharibacteria bacterium]